MLFSLVPEIHASSLDPPLEDNWLTRFSHHLPLLSKQEQFKPNPKLYTIGTDNKYKITNNISNIKQETHDKCFNKHSTLRSPNAMLEISLAKSWEEGSYLIFKPIKGLSREIILLEQTGSEIKQLPKWVIYDRDNWLPEQSPKVSSVTLKQPTLAKA